MMKIFKIIFLLTIMFLLTSRALAGGPVVAVTQIFSPGVDFNITTTDMCISKKGTMYIGTHAGLLRREDIKSSFAFIYREDPVMKVCVREAENGEDGVLACTQAKLLYSKNGRSGFEPVFSFELDGGEEVIALYASKNHVFLATNKKFWGAKIPSRESDTWEFRNITVPPNLGRVKGVFTLDDCIFGVIEEGFAIFGLDDFAFIKHQRASPMRHSKIDNVEVKTACLSGGRIWIITNSSFYDGSVAYSDNKGNTFTHCFSLQAGTDVKMHVSGNVACLVEEGIGERRVYVSFDANEKLPHFQETVDFPDRRFLVSYSAAPISVYTYGPLNAVFAFNTTEGIYFTNNGKFWTNRTDDDWKKASEGMALPSNCVYSIFEKNGIFYVCTDVGIFSSMDMQKFKTIIDGSKFLGFGLERIVDVSDDGVVCVMDGGLNYLYTVYGGMVKCVLSKPIHDVKRGKDGRMLAADSEKLYLEKAIGSFEFAPIDKTYTCQNVDPFFVAKKNFGAWSCSKSGLFTVYPNFKIRKIVEFNGIRYLGTNNGIICHDSVSDKDRTILRGNVIDFSVSKSAICAIVSFPGEEFPVLRLSTDGGDSFQHIQCEMQMYMICYSSEGDCFYVATRSGIIKIKIYPAATFSSMSV